MQDPGTIWLWLAAMLIVVGVCIAAMALVHRHAVRSNGTNAEVIWKCAEQAFRERQWYASNSLEAKAMAQHREILTALTAAAESANDKVLAFTQEGRDFVRMRGEIQVLKDGMRARDEAHDAIMAALQVGKQGPGDVPPPPPSTRVSEANGVTTASFRAEP